MNAAALQAGALVAAAVVVLWPPDPLRRLTEARGGRRAPGRVRRPAPGSAVIRRWRDWFGRRRHRQARRADVVEACLAITAELAAGREPGMALAEAARAADWLRPAAAAAAVGGDVPAALRQAAAAPGAEALALLAAGWTVAQRSGIPLAGVATRVADAVRDDAACAREVAAQLAPVRATGRLLALLPAMPLLMGSALGASPWRELTGSVWGLGSLLGGVTLAVAGWAWVERLATSAESSMWRP